MVFPCQGTRGWVTDIPAQPIYIPSKKFHTAVGSNLEIRTGSGLGDKHKHGNMIDGQVQQMIKMELMIE